MLHAALRHPIRMVKSNRDKDVVQVSAQDDAHMKDLVRMKEVIERARGKAFRNAIRT